MQVPAPHLRRGRTSGYDGGRSSSSRAAAASCGSSACPAHASRTRPPVRVLLRRRQRKGRAVAGRLPARRWVARRIEHSEPAPSARSHASSRPIRSCVAPRRPPRRLPRPCRRTGAGREGPAPPPVRAHKPPPWGPRARRRSPVCRRPPGRRRVSSGSVNMEGSRRESRRHTSVGMQSGLARPSAAGRQGQDRKSVV